MIKSKDLHEGTVIEVVSTNYMMFFGGINPTINDYLAIGEKYEVTKVKRSSPLEVHMKQVNGGKGGSIYLNFISNDIKIVSQPELKAVENTDSNNLAPNEEFILVKKGEPTQFYKDYLQCDDEDETGEYIPKDEDALIFTNKIGQRKKIKNKLSLIAILNILSGVSYATYWFDRCNKLPKDKVDLHYYHMVIIKDVHYWYEPMQISNIESIKNLELRKYNKDTRKVSDTVVDFDCYEYVKNFIVKMNNTFNYGVGIASVVDELKSKDLEKEYPFLFSSKFDHTKFKSTHPLEKDIYFDLALKSLKLKKKDVIYYNDKGFVCVAFKNEEERDNFIKEYKNTEKVQTLSLTNDVLASESKKKLKI